MRWWIRSSLLVVLPLAAACQPSSSLSPAPAPGAGGSAAQAEAFRVPTRLGTMQVTTVVRGLAHPWGLAFLPEGGMLVTERPGRLRRVGPDGSVSAPIAGVPEVVAEGQGGLLDVAISPDFAQDRWVYLSLAEPGEDGLAGTAVVRGRLEGDRLSAVEVVFRQQPKTSSRHHFGSRLVFLDGHLFITLGDRGERIEAQNTGNHLGTVVRIRPDGSIPEDNPLVGRPDARPEIWSWGHRNQQGAAVNPWTGVLWTHEHGPKGGDEINIPLAGRNYGWPIITYGINYSGLPIPEAEGVAREGLEQPWHHWAVSPAISGMAFYDHERFPAWRRSLFIGALAQRALIRLSLDDASRVVAEERLLEAQGWRIRDVRCGPDGAVWVLTDEDDGRLLRLELEA